MDRVATGIVVRHCLKDTGFKCCRLSTNRDCDERFLETKVPSKQRQQERGFLLLQPLDHVGFDRGIPKRNDDRIRRLHNVRSIANGQRSHQRGAVNRWELDTYSRTIQDLSLSRSAVEMDHKGAETTEREIVRHCEGSSLLAVHGNWLIGCVGKSRVHV